METQAIQYIVTFLILLLAILPTIIAGMDKGPAAAAITLLLTIIAAELGLMLFGDLATAFLT
jgi:hypothetical protein